MFSKITIYGDANQKRRAMELFASIDENRSESDNRLIIQDIIDTHNFKGTVLYDGNTVRSYKKVMQDVEQLVQKGILAFSDYLYKFGSLACGTIAHYNKDGWLSVYDTPHTIINLFMNASHPSRASDRINIKKGLQGKYGRS